ncbi:hypothetical protein O1611_g10599 [Lasiodiplodia mahajangana]|uniref:Uncharacterized protein n=1 Tax=Lasiodiplodia mahajangana TaxID=1108764 RepID=A0ACC2IWE9_9PEZI|nr:hypothetical protein O1611_g10599 [Lasiodiplodia mahajangana]
MPSSLMPSPFPRPSSPPPYKASPLLPPSPSPSPSPKPAKNSSTSSPFEFKAGFQAAGSGESVPFIFSTPTSEVEIPAPLTPVRKGKAFEFRAGVRPARTNPNLPFTFAMKAEGSVPSIKIDTDKMVSGPVTPLN